MCVAYIYDSELHLTNLVIQRCYIYNKGRKGGGHASGMRMGETFGSTTNMVDVGLVRFLKRMMFFAQVS